MIKQIDHMAIAVRDLEKAKRFFLDGLGGKKIWSAPMAGQGFRWTTIELGASCMIELINPEGEPDEVENGMVQKFLDRRGEGPHHITIQVEDLARSKATLDERGIPCFGYGEPLAGWKELFIHPKHAFGVLIQFAEFDPYQWLDPERPVPVPYRRFAPHGTSNASDVQVERIEGPGGEHIEIRSGQQHVSIPKQALGGLIEALIKAGG